MKKSRFVYPLWMGVEKREINPPDGVYLFGFPALRMSRTVESDLYVRTAVFGESPERPSAVLTVIDTLYVSSALAGEIRRAAARRVPGLKPSAILVAATHTHSAPALQPYCMGKAADGIFRPHNAYRRKVIREAVNSIAGAWKKMRPVTVRAGEGSAALGHNRRPVIAGCVVNEWQDLRRRHTGYFNPAVPFVSFHDAVTGKIYAVLAGYGCHPVTLGPGNCKASPDYPGYFVRSLEKKTGAEAAIFISTGAADINPLRCLREDSKLTVKTGNALSAAVVRSLKTSRPVKPGPVAVRTVPLRFRLKENISAWPRTNLIGRDAGPFLKTEVQAIRLGDLVLVSAPGELFSGIAAKVAQSAPGRKIMTVEHANDAAGYIFTDAAALEGGYEVCRGSVSESMERPYLTAVRKVIGML